jgi:TonB family protein
VRAERVREVGLQHTRRRTTSIIAISLVAHAAVLVWFDLHLGRVTGDAGQGAGLEDLSIEPAVPVAGSAAGDQDPLAGVALVDEDMLGELLAARVGPADQAGFDLAHPMPSADVDLPGESAAGRGGGDDEGGVPSFSGRRDRDQLRSQIWNGLAAYQVPHRQNAERSSTPESLARLPETGFDSRKSRARRARAGAAAAQIGEPGADGTGGRVDEVERAWRDADPRLDTGPAAMQLQRQVGSTEPGEARPLVDRGPTAVETERPGPALDATSAAAASSERDPMPLELTRASAGGREEEGGVEGPSRQGGVSATSPLGGSVTSATRAHLVQGAGRPALRAHRQDPYFRRMYQRIDSVVEYPRRLAMALEQGEVIVAFTLLANGSIGEVRVLKSSGFEEFDDELTRALRVAAPFGPVPSSLRGRSDRVEVMAPYKFSSPLIR